jgi:surfeit locus 1 family protein
MLLLTLAGCALFAVLGNWQFHRGANRSIQWSQFQNPGDGQRDVTAADLGALPIFARVRLAGTYDGEHQFLLDNISAGGRVGFYVLTPLRQPDGSAVLVNRGFIPGTGRRENLPDIALSPDTSTRVVLGRVGALPVAGLASGQLAPAPTGAWPRVASFPTLAQLGAVLPYPLAPGVVLAEDDGGPALLREWRPPGLEPARHYAYAVQWWAFAVLALVLFITLNFRRKTS